MWCAKCNKQVGQCTCGDIEERLAALGDTIVYCMCKKCNKHYSGCSCKHPDWISSNPNIPLPKEFSAPNKRKKP